MSIASPAFLARTARLLIGTAASGFGWAELTLDAAAQSKTIVLDEITVEGARRGGAGVPPATGTVGKPPPAYAGGQVGSGARLGVLGNRSVFNTPFNISSYTGKLIRDQQAQSLIDVAENDPSVRAAASISAAEGSTLYIRGFPVYPLDLGFDGLFGIVDGRRPPVFNIERVEVLKGPSALVNGVAPNGGVGGSINFIPKRADDVPLTRVTPFFISRGQFGTAVDIGRRYGPNGEWGVRANGVYQRGGTPIDKERLQLGFGSLGVDYRNDRFRMSFDLSYQNTDYHQNRSFIFVAPGIQIPRAPSLTTNINQPSEFQNTGTLLGATRFEYDIAPTTTLFAGFGSGTIWESAVATIKTISDPTGDFSNLFVRQAYNSQTYTGDTGVRTRFDTGPVQHSAIMAVTGYWYDLRFPKAVQFLPSAGVSNLYNPRFVASPFNADIGIGDARGTSQNNSSVALADTLSMFNERINLTLGGRVQQLGAKGYDFTPGSPTFGQVTTSYDRTTPTPAVALLVKPTERLSLYGNYVETLISPGAAPATASNANEVLAPIVGRQKEVGAKYDFGPVGATASLFEIERPNAFQDPVTLRFAADGLQRNRGFEFNIFGAPLSYLRLVGGLALLDGRLVRTEGGTNDGNIAPTVPKVSLNLYGEYDLPRWMLPGLTATGRVIYTSSQFYDPANTQSIPDWTRFDAGLRYTFFRAPGKPVVLRANVVNVFGTNYWTSTGLGLLSLGTPRTFLLSAQVDL